MSEHRDSSFKWLMFFFACFASTVLAIGLWAFFSYSPESIKAIGEPAGEFDDPDRDPWQRPETVVSELKLKPKQVVADIGAGTGYFSFRIAREQPNVKVYAAEIEDDMVNYLAEIAKKAGFRNVIAFQIDPNTPNLPEKIDLALLVDTYHHMDNHIRYFEKLRSLLRPNGRVAIIDFPSAHDEHNISKDKVIKDLAAAGFTLDREVRLPEQYFLFFKSESDER